MFGRVISVGRLGVEMTSENLDGSQRISGTEAGIGLPGGTEADGYEYMNVKPGFEDVEEAWSNASRTFDERACHVQ